jgi:hypothetical protein
MKKIKITPYKALSLIFIILSTGSHSLAAPSLIGCTVQFSKDSTAIELSVNYGGSQITTTLHKTTTPKITFEIPKSITQTHFEVLITLAKIDYQLKGRSDQKDIQNTIDYIKIDPQSSYKYYILDLINDAWEIKEDTLPETGQIPDRAIIIECYPEWISDFKGGSAVELPTLYLNNAANDKKESNEKLEEDLIKLELTALDSKLFYAPIRRQIQTASDKKRVLIMDLIT